MTHYCINCSDDVQPGRWNLGFKICLTCGEELARATRHCIVPMHKSTYQPITDINVLKQLNKYSNCSV